MKSQIASYASRKREVERRALREYCRKFTYKGTFSHSCYNCEFIKGDNDCQGNLIGTMQLKVARSLQSVLELPVSSTTTFKTRKGKSGD